MCSIGWPLAHPALKFTTQHSGAENLSCFYSYNIRNCVSYWRSFRPPPLGRHWQIFWVASEELHSQLRIVCETFNNHRVPARKKLVRTKKKIFFFKVEITPPMSFKHLRCLILLLNALKLHLKLLSFQNQKKNSKNLKLMGRYPPCQIHAENKSPPPPIPPLRAQSWSLFGSKCHQNFQFAPKICFLGAQCS
jgi:hypothetical protein